MDLIDRQIINQYQGGFPIIDRPFKAISLQLDISESEVLTRISSMLENGILSRFGPLYNIDKMQGTYCLCAMEVPADKFETIADQVNQFPEVAHNYQREHRLNMWFVLAVNSENTIAQLTNEIEQITKLTVLNFPKEKEFYVNFKLSA